MGLLALALGAVTAACSLDDIYGGVIGVDDGAGEGVSKSQRVDGSKEVRVELKTRAAVTVPKDAVEEPVEIGIERPSDEKAVSLARSLKDYQAIVSPPYVLTPHGTKFREPVTIEIPITKQTDKPLVVGWLENESDKTWKKLGVPSSVKDGIAKLEIEHFSVVILLEEDRANLASDDDDAGDDDVGGTPAAKDAGATAPSGSFDAGVFAPVDAGRAMGPADAGAPVMSFPDAAILQLPDAAVFQMPKDAGALGPQDAGAIDAGSQALDAGKSVSDAGNDAAG